MSSAAVRLDRADVHDRPAGRSAEQPGTLRVVLMDDSRFDRRMLRRIAEGSRYPIDFVETPDIASTRAALARRSADLLLLDYRVPDGDGIAFARQLSEEARHAAVPVIVVTGEGSEQAAVQALRSGAADYLCKDGLTTELFDQAVENALRRAAARPADQKAMISNLVEENQTLRRVALRNMRLLKGRTLPLLALAWRGVRGDGDGAAEAAGEAAAGRAGGHAPGHAAGHPTAQDAPPPLASELARTTRDIVSLIDDTVIVAATHRASEVVAPVPLGDVLAAILEDEGGEIRASRAHIRVGRLPTLRARASQMLLLFEELLLTAMRSARLGRVPEIEIGSGVDPQGDPIVWMRERGLRMSARKQALGERFGSLEPRPAPAARDELAWSLCQRIVERSGGQFRISANDGEGSKIQMRFPRSLLA